MSLTTTTTTTGEHKNVEISIMTVPIKTNSFAAIPAILTVIAAAAIEISGKVTTAEILNNRRSDSIKKRLKRD